MYRWPLWLTGEDSDDAEELVLEVPPRGAAFMLPCLMHLGHPIHLALIDAYLRGDVPFPDGTALGDDSRAVLSNLAGPLVWPYRQGLRQASLENLLLMSSRPELAGRSRFLVVTPAGPRSWLACSSDQQAGPLPADGADRISPPWTVVTTRLPSPREIGRGAEFVGGPAAAMVLLREPAVLRPAAAGDDGNLLAAMRALVLGRAAGSAHALGEGLDRADQVMRDAAPCSDDWEILRTVRSDVVLEHARCAGELDDWTEVAPERLVPFLIAAAAEPRARAARTTFQSLPLEATWRPLADGAGLVALIPSTELRQSAAVPAMREAAWSALGGLLELPLDERRTEPIDLRLTGPGGTTVVSIGWSLVLPRNRRVFAAWLGSDGRVLIRLTAEQA